MSHLKGSRFRCVLLACSVVSASKLSELTHERDRKDVTAALSKRVGQLHTVRKYDDRYPHGKIRPVHPGRDLAAL